MHVTCQNSNGIGIPFAFEFPMSTKSCQSMWGGGTILWGVFVSGGDVTHRRPCRMLWSMEVIGKGSAKGICQSIHACVNKQTTFLVQYIILSFLPQMQRLYPANSGSNNGTHNRSIFTITQSMGVGTIVCRWDRTHPLLKTNDIGPTHFYRLQFSEYVCALFRTPSVKSIPHDECPNRLNSI